MVTLLTQLYVLGAIIGFFIELLISKGKLLHSVWVGLSWPLQIILLLWFILVLAPIAFFLKSK